MVLKSTEVTRAEFLPEEERKKLGIDKGLVVVETREVNEMETKEKSVREQVEEWIASAPRCVIVMRPKIELNSESVWTVDRITPSIVKTNYSGTINFVCGDWE